MFNQLVCLDFGPQMGVINKIYKLISPCTRVALASIEIVALGSFTRMGFQITTDISSKLNLCFFFSRLALKENIKMFEKVGF